MNQQPNVRGSLVASTYDFLKKNYGEGFLQRTFQRLSEADRAALKPPHLLLGWYPIDLIERFRAAFNMELAPLGVSAEAFEETLLKEANGVILRTLYAVLFAVLG